MAPDGLSRVLHADSPLWAWAYEAINRRAGGMLAHLEGVRRGEDIEAVHDMRVGSRRLVAAMRVFGSAFPGPGYAALFREARRVTNRLGAVRDLDVLIDYYERLAGKAGPEERAGIAYFIATRERERRRARRPMLAAMDAMERSDLEGRLRRYVREAAEAYSVGLLPEGGADGAGGTRSFRAAAPCILEQRYRAFYAFEPWVSRADAVEELHAMRIAAKWLRYTMELFAPAYADELARPLAGIKKYQELLGDLHDADVRLDILDAMLAGRLDAAGVEAAGAALFPERVSAALAQLRARGAETRRSCYRAFYREWRRQERDDFSAACLRRIRDPDA